MTIEFISLSAFLMGLLGSGHCMGMCGGIAASISPQSQSGALGRTTLNLIIYNLGRISSYTIAGALAGTLGILAGDLIDLQIWSNMLRGIAGLLIILTGLLLIFKLKILSYIEKPAKPIWRYLVVPLIRYCGPVKGRGGIYIMGLLWGWLPCGLVYTAVLLALSSGNALNGAGVMLSFAFGTLPAMLFTGVTLAKLSSLAKKQQIRCASGLIMLLLGAWTLLMPVYHSGHEHMHHAMHSHNHNTK